VVVLAATVERIARPRAPPICCEELNRPDASPASSSRTLVVAMSVSGTNVKPRPADITSRPGRTSAA
jgi:hypothetical protein